MAGHPIRLRADVDAISLQKADMETRGGLVDRRGGFGWNGRAGLEWGRDAWSLFLGWRTGGANIDASDRPFAQGDGVSAGKARIRMNGALLLLRLGAF